MESLGFTNIDYHAIESTLGLPKRCKSDTTALRKPPNDATLDAQIFSSEPPLTTLVLQNPQKLLIRIRTFQVGVKKLCDNVDNFNRNCRTMRVNLKDEVVVLEKLAIWEGLREVGRWIGKVGERVEERERERVRMVEGFEEFVRVGRERIEDIMRRGRGEDWWLERPWYETGEVYHSTVFYENEYGQRGGVN
ncbi:hypothetical protein TWF718_005021 [Orbilia javanica]|uniref:Uncharacterized protein n=1 Tax=Orbilia javanica TaxID=47235 RepID=A0AAN8P0B8_9PEZI